MRKRTDGYCCVTTKHGGSFHLRRDQYAPTRKAWLDGARFLDVVGCHGDRGTLKLADVDGVFDFAPENIMSSVEESRADESDDSLASGAV